MEYIADFFSQYQYIILFFGVIIEGPMLMVASGFLYHQGVFQFWPMLIAIILGDLVGDVLWYYLGYYFIHPILNKYGHYIGITKEKFEAAKELFRTYHAKILIISKITLGFGMALVTLMYAGASKLPFKRYIYLNTAGEIILVFVLLALGYFFGGVYSSVPKDLKIGFIILAVVVMGIILYSFHKYMSKKIAQHIQ